MVFYFSGTGNSQLTAIQIANILDDTLISINQYLKKGKQAVFQSERPLVFVMPTYSWRMPKVVTQWIADTTFQGNQKAYFVLTCAGSCGNAGVYAQKLCAKKGFQFCGLSSVIMPENYLALFETPNTAESLFIIEKAKPCVADLAAQIQTGELLSAPPVSLLGKIESGPINPLFYTLYVHDRAFTVSEQCVSCGKCAQRCPLNNITLTAGKPHWQGNCTHCMACIGGCPVKAIMYKSKSQNRHHHYIMNDSLCWSDGGHDQ